MRYANKIKAMNEAFANAAAQGNVSEIVNLPVEVTVTMSFACNYRWSMCYQTRFDQTLSWDAIERIIPILPFARTLQLFGGEPLLYKHIQKFYELAHQNGCLITMISNGSLLTEDMVESIVANQVHCIKFSIDAGSPATYKKIRGGDYFNVLKGVARLAKRKLEMRTNFPVYDFNFLAMRSNIKELTRLITTAADLDVRAVNVFYPSIHKEELLDECVYFDQERSDEMLAKARDVAQHLGIALNLPPLFSESVNMQDQAAHTACLDPWTKTIISPDGTMGLCCGGNTTLGNIGEQDFEELWNGERARKLRKVVNTPKEPAICKKCRVRKANPNNPELHMPKAMMEKRGVAPLATACEAAV